MGCFDSSSQESTQTSKRPSQNKLLDKLIALFSPEADKGPSVFPGERIAPLTALTTGAIEGAQDVGAAFTTPQTSLGFGGGPLATQTTGAVSDLLAGNLGATPLTAEKFGELFTSAVADPARKTFREETRPAIDEAFAGPGFVSSARSKEIVRQKTDLEDALQSSLSAGQLQNIRQNQALAEAKAGRTQTAVGQAIDVGEATTKTIRDNIAIAASQIQGLGDLIGIGSVEQTQAQKEIFALMTKFAEENQIIDADDLAIMLSLLNLNFGAASGSSSGPGLGFAGASDAFSQVAGAGADILIASDIAVKENIATVDNALDKIKQLGAYTYNYIDDETGKKRIGLIAQEVEKVLPEAVIEIDGVKHVDTYAIQALLVSAINEMLGVN